MPRASRGDTLAPVTAVPALQELARLVSGEPQAALRRLLTLVCEQLAMDVAFVGVLDGAGNRTVRLSALADGTPGPAGITEPLDASWCGRVVQDGVLMVDDGRADPALQALPSTAAFGIVAFAGVPLHDERGAVLGTLCALGHGPHTSLNSRDHDVERLSRPLLEALGDLTGLASA